jgi:hypothetical protein
MRLPVYCSFSVLLRIYLSKRFLYENRKSMDIYNWIAVSRLHYGTPGDMIWISAQNVQLLRNIGALLHTKAICQFNIQQHKVQTKNNGIFCRMPVRHVGLHKILQKDKIGWNKTNVIIGNENFQVSM